MGLLSQSQPSAVTMKFFVLASLLSCGFAAPTNQIHVNSGSPAGPITPAFGDAVQTPKGYVSYALQGFSEDVNQDGFVDPIGQAVAVAPALTFSLPAVLPAVAPVEVKTVSAESLAVSPPLLQYTAASLPVVHAVAPTVVKTGLVPASTEDTKVVPAPPVVSYKAGVPVKVEAGSPVKYVSAPVVHYTSPVITQSSFVPLGSGVPFLSGVVPAVAPAAASVDSPVVEEVGDEVEAV